MDSQPNSARSVAQGDEIALADVWRIIWDGRYLVIGITGALTAIAIVYALLATEWYRADVLLIPTTRQSSSDLRDSLSGLAEIAGIRASPTDSKLEALAVIRSRAFARAFIEQLELLGTFTAESKEPAGLSDIREAVKFFHDNVLRVSEDRDSGQVTVAVEWTDPKVAARWANTLVGMLNRRMRERAIADAETNISYLRKELESTNVIALEQSISRLLESEMEKLMLARGNIEYAFRVVDEAVPPRVRARPRRTFLVASVFVIGGLLSILFALVRSAIRREPVSPT